ncbi:response regulator [Rufibacter immobilis]|uniref:Response regulator n=1 Tax=Rufibacter immobilis TaxID=1348778 RepID=A0A3M9MQV5_9BACT|nr:response regulator [Rufibacter immobilis]RNI27577.1 response regulator [Rufibacter immobilis]
MRSFNKVFLIDDDELHNFLCESIIRNHGFASSVSSFQWAEEALETLQKIALQEPASLPEIIFLDINIPGMNGWDFIEEFQKLPVTITQSCQLFVLSSVVDDKYGNYFPHSTVVRDYFSKPFTTDILDIIYDLHSEQQVG